MRNLDIIGANTLVTIKGRSEVPAKIDTGADSSAIWASDIKVTKEGILKFKLFGEGSPFYTGKVIKRRDFKVTMVKSSNGTSQVRYQAPLSVKIGERKIRALFNLSDRSEGKFPILIGRKSIKNKFLVDVSEVKIKPPKKEIRNSLRAELAKDPKKFHEKYYKKAKGTRAKQKLATLMEEK